MLRAVAAAVAISGARAESANGLGCTAVAIDGRGDKVDSAYAGMNADCSSCDGRVAYIPAADHPEGAMRPLYIIAGTAPRFVGYGRGQFYEPKEGEELSPKLGDVPQVRHTFAYWEAVLPLMNEKGLALGESSCAARLLNYPKGQAPAEGDPRSGVAATEGELDLTNMMQIALERCETARCGVEVMGALAEEYGFFPMVGEWSLGREHDGKVAFADGGEAVTLADRTGESWVFHVVGGVPGVCKSSWAAMRLPKGHAAFVANNFILKEVPEQPTEDWLFSSNIRKAAKAAGLWGGEEPLHFTRVFAPDTVTFESPAGEAPIPLYASLRLWRIFGLAAPTTYGHLTLPVDPLDLPVSVEVENRLGHQDVFAMLSDTYEGTEFDLTLGILAGPYGNPFRIEGGEAARYLGQIPRGISIARTTYSVIGQSQVSREPVMWYAADTPVASVYVPFFPRAGPLHAKAYSTGTLLQFSRESAFWAFDFVANWASMANWQNSSKQMIFPLRRQLHDTIEQEMRVVETQAEAEGVSVLADWQAEIQQRVVDRWWQLADDLIVTYNDGFFNDAKANKLGGSIGYPRWWAAQIGFNQDVHPVYVKRDVEPEATYNEDASKMPPGFTGSTNLLPRDYSFETGTWLYPGSEATASSTSMEAQGSQLAQLLVTGMALICGVLLGRGYERRQQRSNVAPQECYAVLA